MDLEKIKLRLKSLGYEVVEGDEAALEFVIGKVKNHIKHFCNIDEVPDELEYVMIDMCCGEFLKSKKSFGQLTTIQVDQMVKSIKDGDTEVVYQSSTDSMTLLDTYLDKLINGYLDDLLRYRQLVW